MEAKAPPKFILLKQTLFLSQKANTRFTFTKADIKADRKMLHNSTDDSVESITIISMMMIGNVRSIAVIDNTDLSKQVTTVV